MSENAPAPMILTIPPKLAAAIQFEASMTDKSPEAVALDALAESSRCFLEDSHCGYTTWDGLRNEWLAEDEGPRLSAVAHAEN